MKGLVRPLVADRRARAPLAVLAGIVLLALFADVLASDLPLLVRVDGATHVLPCLVRPAALGAESSQSLAARAEWMVRTPIPYGPNQTLAATGEQQELPPPWGPGGAHWLGTDELGRDVLARLVHGARVSLFIAALTVLVAALVGLLIGGVAGLFGGPVDLVLSRLTEVMATFPTIFFLVALLAVLRTPSLWPVALVLGLTRWTDVARLVRAEVQKLKTLDFVLAARAMGAGPAHVLLRHLLPNALGPVIVTATFGVGSAVLLESALSFLGLGVSPPTASWGELLSQAQRTLLVPGAWWLAVFPGAAIGVTVLAVNGVGEALQRTFDARS